MPHITELSLKPYDYTAEAVEPAWFDERERHQTALRELEERVFLQAPSGQQFSGRLLNRDFTDKTPLVLLGAFLSSSNSPDQMYKMYQYAARNSDRRVLFVDMPSHGSSDAMTDEQIAEIYRQRSVSKIGQAQAEAVSDFMPDAAAFITAGDSLGGRVAPDFMARLGHVGVQPETMLGFEIAGVEKRLSMTTGWGYVVGERNLQTGLYHLGNANERLESGYQHFERELRIEGIHTEPFSPLPVIKSDWRIGTMFLARSPLSSDTGMTAIEMVLDENPQLEAAFVCAGLSKITHWDKLQPRMDRIAESFPGRVRWDIWSNDSHSMGLAPQQVRTAAYSRDVIEGLAA